MSQPQETSHDPIRPCQSLLFPVEKIGNFFSRLMKGSLVIFVVFSVSIVIYSALYKQPIWFKCPKCDIVVNTSGERGETHFSTSGDDYEKTNISHILFGIGGSVKSWKNRRHYSELWWQPNVTRGFVWLDENPSGNDSWPENSPPFRVSEDSARFKYRDGHGPRSAVRIARIVSESFRLGLEKVRWFVMGDDDTVFFTHNLVSVLQKYDSDQMYYIGGNSESVEQDVMHTYGMAFGGGGFAISYALAAELVKVLDGCINRYWTFYGSDQKIGACISEIGVPLTKEPGFHQIDIRGDPYGLLAAHPVGPLISLHHLDAVKPLFPSGTQLDAVKVLMGAYEADPGRTLQQSFCYDLDRNWSVSVSWGYTAQIYPYLVTAKDLGTVMRTFQTWRSWKNEPFTFNTRAVSSEPCERPVIYFLDRVEKVRSDETKTSYNRFVAETGTACDRVQYRRALAVKSVKVSAVKMASDIWTKEAPRRQCCKIKRTRGSVKSVEVEIKGCKPGETATLP